MGEQPALLTADNPVFSGFVFWSGVLALKMLLLYFLTVRQRFKKKIFISPEDTFFAPSGDGQVRYDDPDIERIRRAHQNDVENIPLFFVVGFLYVLSGPSEAVALNLFRAYTAARIVHTLVYAVVVTRQPVRAIAFFVGLSITLAMAVLTLAAVSFTKQTRHAKARDRTLPDLPVLNVDTTSTCNVNSNDKL